MIPSTSLLRAAGVVLLGLVSCAPPPELPREPVAYVRGSAPAYGPLPHCPREFQESARRAATTSAEPAQATPAKRPDRLSAHCYTHTGGTTSACMVPSDPLLLLALDIRAGMPACVVGPFQPEPPTNDACCYRLGYRAE